MRSEAKTNNARGEAPSRAVRVRRKLRALRASRGGNPFVTKAAKRRAQSVEQVSAVAPALGHITNALAAAIAGYELCARRTHDANVAVAVNSAASSLKALLEAMVGEAATYNVDAKPRTRIGDRMHWEWLASTGVVMDGAVDSRLLDECARILGDVIGLDVSPLGDAYATKVRLASAEAWSLASAVAPRRGIALAAIA